MQLVSSSIRNALPAPTADDFSETVISILKTACLIAKLVKICVIFLIKGWITL